VRLNDGDLVEVSGVRLNFIFASSIRHAMPAPVRRLLQRRAYQPLRAASNLVASSRLVSLSLIITISALSLYYLSSFKRKGPPCSNLWSGWSWILSDTRFRYRPREHAARSTHRHRGYRSTLPGGSRPLAFSPHLFRAECWMPFTTMAPKSPDLYHFQQPELDRNSGCAAHAWAQLESEKKQACQ